MSTRSNIAIEDPKTKKVKVIYVHCDGYPHGVGKILNDHYNTRALAAQLFKHGDASYLGATIEECSFYSRDWDRKEDPARTYRDEWMLMFNMRGDVFIEYIYLFKDDQWHVATSKYVKTPDGYDSGTSYYTKFEPVSLNKEYIKHKDSGHEHTEVKMISQMGKMLAGAGFEGDNVVVQGGKAKKAN